MIDKIICNRYKILEHLGTGGMATVWLGYDTILDRKVAIKTFKIDADDEDAIKRFNREAKAVTSLAHPNIVSIYDVENENNFYYLILEYVEGMTLKDYMAKNQNIPVETVIHIIKQISRGLSHAHQKGIVHRDIKPQNILMKPDMTCKITDFGIARAYGDTTMTQTNQMLGTVYYLSPEQARGNIATAQSDIYSLGILMFEMLTGRIPFKGESAVAIALKHLQEPLPDIDKYRQGIPQSVKNIVIKATMKNPNERYISSKELIEDIDTCLNFERLNENIYTGFSAMSNVNTSENLNNTQYLNSKEFYEEDDYEEPYSQDNYVYQEDPYITSNPKKKKSVVGNIIIALLVIVLICTGTAFGYNYLVNKDKVTVPDLRNMDLATAKTTLQKSNLELGDVTEVASDTVTKGNVIDSDPKSGKKTSKNSKIDLTVSSGKSTVDMPNYVGLSEDNVKKNLSKLEFRSVTFEREESDEYDEGKVISQNISAGSEIIPKDKDLIVKISKGKKKVSVPNFVGKTLTDAYSLAENNNLSIVVKSYENSDKYDENVVMSQSIDSGNSVSSGSKVEIIVSKGTSSKSETDVTFTWSKVSSSIRKQLEEGQTVYIYTTDSKGQYNSTPVITKKIEDVDTDSYTFSMLTNGKYKVVVETVMVYESN